jgi:hypothetical protein
MAHGARPDIFTFAMLDRVDAVRALCEAMPGIQRTRGPHGITLLRHAKNGEAARVEEYLAGLDGADEPEPLLETAAEEASRYFGTYAWEGGGEARLVVEAGRGGIGILRRGGNLCALRRTGDHAFSPAGAPHVTVRFAMADGRANALTVERPGLVLSAVRVEG